MLDWVFEGIISWVGEHVNSLLDAVSGIMLDTLGVDMTVMSSYFPFLETAFQTIKYIGIILLLLMVIWQLFRAFAGPVLEAENPLTLLARGILSAFCIWNSREIFDILLYIAKAPYDVLREIPVATYSFTDIYSFLHTGLQTAVGAVVMSQPILSLLAIILIIALGWNYLKLLLEVVERYIMVGILYFSSPLAFSMLGTKSTANVFKAWCRMAGSELLLLVLNVWFIRGYNSGVTVLMLNGGVVSGRPAAGAILCLFCLLAYLKIAQKFDAYLATLGLNTAQTGGNLGMEMLVMTRMVGGMIGRGGFLHGGRVGANTGNVTSGATGNAAPAGFGTRVRAAFSGETYRANAISSGPNHGIGGVNGWVLNSIAARQIRQGHATDPVTVSRITNGTISPRGGAFTGISADNSLAGFMPMFRGHQLSGTSIENGRISTTVTSPSGQKTGFEAFSADAYEKPEGAFRTVTASDGSRWYMTANGDGAKAFFAAQQFEGHASESGAVAEMFPNEPDIASLKTVGDGQMDATYADGSHGMMYAAALFEEPEGPHEIVTDENGLDWYKMEPSANITGFSDGMPDESPSSADEYNGTPVPGSEADVPSPNVDVGEDTATHSGTPLPLPPQNSGSAENIVNDASAPEGEDITEIAESVTVPGSTAVPPVPGNASVPDESGIASFDSATMPASTDAASAIPGNSADTVAVHSAAESADTVEIPAFNGLPDGTQITSSGDGIYEMKMPDGKTQTVYDSGRYTVSDTESGIDGSITDDTGHSYFIPAANTAIERIPASSADNAGIGHGNADHYDSGSAPTEELSPSGSGISSVTPDRPSQTDTSDTGIPSDYHNGISSSRGSFTSFMPGYGADVAKVDTSLREEGQFTVYNKDGTGTRFYDMTMFRPVGNYRVFEDRNGHSWAAYDGKYQSVRHVITDQNGEPVVDKRGRAKERYETVMTFRQEPQRIKSPAKRKPTETKTPRRKKK